MRDLTTCKMTGTVFILYIFLSSFTYFPFLPEKGEERDAEVSN